MIGAILLTFRKRLVKKQSYINQISRNPSAVELVEVKTNQGVKIDD